MKLSLLFMTFLMPCFLILGSFASAQQTPEEQAEHVVTTPEATPTLKDKPFQNLFESGVNAYQNKQYKEACEFFLAAEQKNPDNPTVLTNLGLCHYQLGKKSWAIAYFRRALNFYPGFTAAKQGLNFAQSKLEIKELPHQIQNYEILREWVLMPFSLSTFLFFSALFFGFASWLLINYLGKRKWSRIEDSASPTTPIIGILFLTAFITCITLTGFKIYDSQITRATVVEDKIPVVTAPGENQASLFDLYGGLEIILRTQSGDWAQVTYPGGLTGWVKKSALYITSKESIW